MFNDFDLKNIDYNPFLFLPDLEPDPSTNDIHNLSNEQIQEIFSNSISPSSLAVIDSFFSSEQGCSLPPETNHLQHKPAVPSVLSPSKENQISKEGMDRERMQKEKAIALPTIQKKDNQAAPSSVSRKQRKLALKNEVENNIALHNEILINVAHHMNTVDLPIECDPYTPFFSQNNSSKASLIGIKRCFEQIVDENKKIRHSLAEKNQPDRHRLFPLANTAVAVNRCQPRVQRKAGRPEAERGGTWGTWGTWGIGNH